MTSRVFRNQSTSVSRQSKHRRRLLLAASIALSWGAALLAPSCLVAQSPPTVDFQWNNFISSGTNWSTGTNWLPGGPPTGSIDRVLGFGSSNLQTVTGYTTTNNTGAFDVNSLVFTANSSASGGVTLTNTLAADTIRFNTGSGGLLPSIWQMGTGRVTFRHAIAGANGITLANGTTLQIRGSGFGDVYLDTSIGQTGAGASGIQINQTGIRSFFTGSVTRLGGSGSTFTGGVDLTSGNLMLSNVLGTTGVFSPTVSVAATSVNSLGTGVLTINGVNTSLQFDPLAISSGASPTGATGTLQVNNNVVLNSTLNLTGVAPATAPSGSIVGIFAGNISGVGGVNIAPTNGTVNFAFTGNNTFSGPVNISAVGNSTSTLLIGTANVSTGNLSGTTSLTVTGNSSLTLNNVFGAATRLNTTTAPNLTLNRANFNQFGNPTASVSETLGTLTVNGMGSIQALAGSQTVGTASLTFASLDRGADGRGTLSLTGTRLGAGTGNGEGIISFTTNPGGAIGGGGGVGTTNRDILAYAAVNSQVLFAGITGTLTPAGTTLNGTFVTSQAPSLGLARWDAGTLRIAPLAANEYATNLYTTGITAPTANMRLQSVATALNASSAAGINSPTTINALVLDTNIVGSVAPIAGVSVGGSGTLKVGSGAILVGTGGNSLTVTNNVHPSMINLGGLDFGNATGYFHTNSNLIVNAPITGTNGVVKSLGGTLILNGNNTFTGGLALNSGPVQFSTDSNLGAAGGAITLNSGLTTGLSYLPSNLFASTPSGNVTVNRPITVGAAGGVVSVGLASSNLTLPGTISGTGQFFKAGAGILTLSGTNTYTGNTVAAAGILAVQNDGALGATSGSVILAGGTFQPNTSFSTNRDFLATAPSTIFTNGQNLTINGNLGSQQQPSATLTLFKAGLGTLNLTAANTFNQSFQLGESTPTVRASSPSGAQGAGTLVLSGQNGGINQAASVFSIGGGELILDNSVDANSNRLPNATLSLVGGNVTLIGNASTPINEQIGAISINNTNNQYGGRLTIDSPTGAGATTLTSTAAYSPQAAPNVGTLFVRGTNLGATTGDRAVLILPTNPTQTNGLIASMVGATSATAADATDFLTTTPITNAAPNANQFSVVPFTAYTAGGAVGAGGATLTYDVNSATTFTGASAANAIRIGSGGGIDLGGGTLTMTSGSILTTGGANTGISNGTLAYGAGVTARFSVASGSDLTIAGPITGTTGGLNKLGGGTLTLNGAVSTTTGLVGISAGTLRLGGSSILSVTSTPFINVGAKLDLNNNNTTLGGLVGWGDTNLGSGNLTIDSTTSPILAYGGGFIGTGALIKQNTNTQVLAGNSTGFSGDVRILGGNLTVNSTGALGTGTSSILLGNTSGTTQATLSLSASVNTFSRDIIVQAGSTPTTAHTLAMGSGINTVSSNVVMNNGFRLTGTSGAAGGTTTMSGTLSGAGSLTVFSGNWSFTGNNTYAGGTTFDTTTASWAGVGGNSAFGTGAITFTTGFGTNLRADGGARTLANQINLQSTGGYFGVAGTNDLTLNGNVDLQGATVAQTLNIFNTGTTTINGIIQNGTGGLVKNGVGTLYLMNANTYTGGTTLNAGVLGIGNNSAFGAGALTVNDGVVLRAVDADRTIANNVTLNGTTGIDGSNALTVNGTVGLGAATRTIVVNNPTTTLAGVISGTAGSGITKDGAGTLNLTAANTYTGTTTVNNGVLGIGNNAALGTGAVQVNNGAVLRAVGADRTIANNVTFNGNAGIDGSNALTVNGTVDLGAATRTINVNNTATTMAGIISGAAGSGITKDGSGSLNLTGANTYSGTTTVANGALLVNNTTGSGTGSGSVVVNAGATLGGSGTILPTGSNTVTVNGNLSPGNSPGTLTIGSIGSPTTFALNGSFTFELATAGTSGAAANSGSSTIATGVSHDFLNVFGTMNFGAASTFNITSLGSTGFDNTQNYSWLVASSNGGTINGSPTLGTALGTDFLSAPIGNFALGTAGGNLFLNFTGISAVPEPSTFALIAAAGSVGWVLRRRKKVIGKVPANA